MENNNEHKPEKYPIEFDKDTLLKLKTISLVSSVSVSEIVNLYVTKGLENIDIKIDK